MDVKLWDVTAVQTLSRLNRTTFGKNSTFVLDFENTEGDIKSAFLPYYEMTTLEGGTDVNLVCDLRNKIRDFVFRAVRVFHCCQKWLSIMVLEIWHRLQRKSLDCPK